MKTSFKFTLTLVLVITLNWVIAQQVNPPIKGVGTVVKRNRPPNYGSKVTANTNEKGETTVQIAEKGNYIITVLQPSPTSTAMTETQGGPVKGVKVALGKNPSGLLVSTQPVNDKGEAEFKDLEPGSYTIKVESSTKDCPPGWYNLNGTCIPNEPRNPNSTTTKDYVGHVTLLRYSQWYFGGGLQVPSSTTKTSGIVNGIDLNLGYYHPIWAWDKSNISLGINGELGYTMGNGSYDINNQYTVYQLVGQTQQPLITENTKSIKSTSFRAGAGLQMNIHFGKFIVSPIMNAGYLNTTQKTYSVDETIYPQLTSATYRLFEQKETKTSGLGIFPKLRFTYMLSSRIGIWLEGNYTIGSKMNTETTRFVIDPTIPLNNINEGNFQEGKYITSKNEMSFSAVGVNGGVIVSLGKRKGVKTKGNDGWDVQVGAGVQKTKVDEYSNTKPIGSNLINTPCFEIIKTLYCYDGNNNCKLICDNVNNSFCGMYTSKKEIPCNTSTPTGTVNSLIKTYIFNQISNDANELSYGEIKEIVKGILPSFAIENITLNSFKDNYLLLVEGNQNKISANVNIMLSNNNGKLYTTDDIRILQCSDPNGIKQTRKRKHDYVGHVTLLR